MVSRWRGWRFVSVVLVFATVTSFVLMGSHGLSIYLSAIPIVVGYPAAYLTDYRGRRGFWPWNMKRRKIERYGWLVESRAGDDA